MNQLTKLFGKHLEYIGELCGSDRRITQNPAFFRMVQLKGEETLEVVDKFGPSLISAKVKLSNCYDMHIPAGDGQRFYYQGQPVLIVQSNSITMLENVSANSDYFSMVEFHIDEQGYLHAKVMEFIDRDIEISNSIYDEHGVELQRDTLTDSVPKHVKRELASCISDSVGYARILRNFFLQFQFGCSFGKMPLYVKSSRPKYLGYRRDMRYFEYVLTILSNGKTLKERLSTEHGIATMGTSCPLVYPATKEDLVASIALEENEETRNALIEYCKYRGVTKDMVMRKKA